MSEMPTELVVQDKNGRVVTDLRTVAAKFGKEHRNVVRDIKAILKSKKTQEKMKRGVLKIEHTPYIHPQNGQIYDKYLLDREAFSLLAMGFTGDEALEFKLDYIEAFVAMEKKLTAPAAPATQLEVLVGVANGLLEQDRKLKEIEGKFVEADERNRATAEKVSELDHVFHTNGCAKGFIPFTDVRMTYGKSVWEGIDVQSYRQEARTRLRSHGRGDPRGAARDARHQRPGRPG